MADKQTNLQVVLSMIDKATAPLNAFNKRVQKMTDPIRQVNNRLALLGEAAGLGKLKTAVGGVGKAFGDVVDRAGALAMKVGAIAGAAGLAIFGLIKMTSDAGDEAVKSAQKAGIGVEAWQEYAHAAALADVSQEGLLRSFKELNVKMVDAVTGGKESAKWFSRAGISIAQLKNMKAEDVIERVADQFAAMPDGAKKSTLAVKLFGKAGLDMIPLLNGGAKAIAEARREAHELGLVMGKDAALAGEAFNDNMTRLQRATKGLGMIIGAALMPFVNDLVVSLKGWIVANRDLVKSRVAEFVERLRENMPAIIAGFQDFAAGVQSVFSILLKFVDLVGGWGNALMIAAGIMAGPLLLSLVTLGQSIVALGVALWATPIGWFIAGVVAIAGAALLIYKNWEPIKKFFADLWDGAVAGLKWFADQAMKVLEYSPVGLLLKGVGMIGAKVGKLFVPGEQVGAGATAAATGAQTNTNNAAVRVDFQNVPRGVQVTPGNRNTAPLDLNMGYAMAAP